MGAGLNLHGENIFPYGQSQLALLNDYTSKGILKKMGGSNEFKNNFLAIGRGAIKTLFPDPQDK